jgi:hypothetical protein
MQAKYPLKIQAIRSKNQQARLYVYLPLKSKPLKGPPTPPKIRCLLKSTLLKPNGAVYLTEVTHDPPVSEN